MALCVCWELISDRCRRINLIALAWAFVWNRASDLMEYESNKLKIWPHFSNRTQRYILPSVEHHRRVHDYEPIPVDLERLEVRSDHVSLTRYRGRKQASITTETLPV